MEQNHEFEIDGKTFRVVGLMEPKKAWNVARRLMPLGGALKELLPLALQFRGGEINSDNVAAALSLLEPITQYLSRMPDADSDFVIDACLDVVQFKTGQDRGWVRIATGGQLMFEWITMPMMIRMTVEVVRENLTTFFPGLASALAEA